MLFFGIDPGLYGAIGVIEDSNPPRVVDVFDFPLIQVEVNGKVKNQIDRAATYRIFSAFRGHVRHAFIELISGMPPQRKTNKDGSDAFMGGASNLNLGINFDIPQTICVCCGIPYTLIPPFVWKRYVQVSSVKDSSRMRASQIFPAGCHHWPLKKHDGRAEAVLIGYTGLMKRGTYNVC